MQRQPATTQTCSLCERIVHATSKHHLIPKSEGGELTVALCSACHSTLHRFFTNRTLAREKCTLEALRADGDIQRYLNWVRRQPDRRIKVHRKRSRH